MRVVFCKECRNLVNNIPEIWKCLMSFTYSNKNGVVKIACIIRAIPRPPELNRHILIGDLANQNLVCIVPLYLYHCMERSICSVNIYFLTLAVFISYVHRKCSSRVGFLQGLTVLGNDSAFETLWAVGVTLMLLLMYSNAG